MSLPKCCGSIMKINVETQMFYELVCQNCGDAVYIKKDVELKPQMIDD